MTVADVSDPMDDLMRSWWILVISGILSVAIGCLLIFWPGQTLTVATALFGALMILSGVVRFFQAVFSSGPDHRWLLLISAILGVAIGIVVIRNPESVISLIVASRRCSGSSGKWSTCSVVWLTRAWPTGAHASDSV